MGRAHPKGNIRPRVYCPYCGRSIAVTFNKRNGDAYIRSHVREPGHACKGSQKTVLSQERDSERFAMHYGIQPNREPRV
jgi:hypothetical protein